MPECERCDETIRDDENQVALPAGYVCGRCYDAMRRRNKYV